MTIETALHATFTPLCALQDRLTDPSAIAALSCAFADARHHVCQAIAFVDFEEKSLAEFAAREAYLSALTLWQYTFRHTDADATRAVDALLDALEPHVSRADAALRTLERIADPDERDRAFLEKCRELSGEA